MHVAFRLILLALTAFAGALPGLAASWDEDLFLRPEDLRTVLFGSLDAGRSVFVSAGAKQSLTGPLDRPGFLALETSGYGVNPERFRQGPFSLPASRMTQENALLAGFQWTRDVYLAIFAGPEVSHQQLTVASRVYRWSQPRIGLRGQAELWWNASPDVAVMGSTTGSTARGSLWARAAAGYLVAGAAYLGPELTVYTAPRYLELRYGAHLTGYRLGILNLRLSGGVLQADDRRGVSPYLGLSGWIRM